MKPTERPRAFFFFNTLILNSSIRTFVTFVLITFLVIQKDIDILKVKVPQMCKGIACHLPKNTDSRLSQWSVNASEESMGESAFTKLTKS